MTTPCQRAVRVLFAGLVLACALRTLPLAADGRPAWLDRYSEPSARIIGQALTDTFAWDRLTYMTDTFGHRLSGSEALERAIAWAADEMKRDGLENVRTEPVMVPRWVRGEERLEVVAPVRRDLPLLGLGMSVGTPAAGVEAETLVVSSFDDLTKRASEARGRIVVFNVPFTTYGETVRYRSGGATEAARAGAVAMLLRSVGLPGLRTPHTGTLEYRDPAVPRIPAAAIALEDAEMLQRMQDRGSRTVLRLTMGARQLADAPSANVVAEIRGREKPEEIVVLGAHIDSWDVGTGATDDAGGCVATWEAVRLLSKLGLRPRRTVRVVLFVNEENGLRGGLAYRDGHRDELDRHVMMLEADAGISQPLGFGVTAAAASMETVRAAASLLRGIGASRVTPGGGGADIGPAVEAGRIPAMSLSVDTTRYFLTHHTHADTVDKIAPGDLQRCVAALAVMAYVVADLPERLTRDPQ
jgi:carboxypeptidase Q